jgi:calcineurin-like phosphoesterase family protein
MTQPREWFTADLHFNHEKVALLRGFTSAEAHDETIIANWNAVVGPHDIAWVLGDCTVGPAAAMWPLADRMNGTRHLVCGNHDAPFAAHRDASKHQREWMEHFETVQQGARRRIEGQDVILSHLPYAGAGDHTDGEERYPQWRLPDLGSWLLHGHVHGKWQLNGRMLNVGVDAWSMAPVPLARVQEVIRLADHAGTMDARQVALHG